tara:strand:- start:273 stop:551 length:279 start_codon:yes stop_codon:yes gene_type:complete
MAKPSKSNLRFIKDPQLDPYYIQLDEYCYIAQKSTFSEAGHEYQNTLGHYTTLGGCLESIARDDAKSTNYKSLKTFVERFEAKTNELKNLIK